MNQCSACIPTLWGHKRAHRALPNATVDVTMWVIKRRSSFKDGAMNQLSSCSLAMLEMSGRSILKPISVFYASFVAASVYLIGCSVSSRTLLTNDSSIDLLGCSVGETRFCVTSRSLENPAYSSPRPGAERQGKSEKLLPVSPRVPTVAQES